MHNLENTCDARFWGGESIATTFVAIGAMLKALERSPSFDLEFVLEGITQGQNGLDFRTAEVILRPWSNFGANRCSTLKIVSVAVANFTDIAVSGACSRCAARTLIGVRGLIT